MTAILISSSLDEDSGYPANHRARVYRNNGSTLNSVPSAPTGLTATINSSTSVTLAWTAPSDTQTPSAGLNYNLRVGTTPGGQEVVAPMSFQNPPSSQPDGLRKIAQLGPVQGTSWVPKNLTPGQTYYWSVQAIDTALAGGPFNTENTFTLPAPRWRAWEQLSMPTATPHRPPADHTDFGTTLVAGGMINRTFTISNSGNAALNLSGTPKVTIGGTNAGRL